MPETAVASDITFAEAMTRSTFHSLLIKEVLHCWFCRVTAAVAKGESVVEGRGKMCQASLDYLQPLGYVFDASGGCDLSVSGVTEESFGDIQSICASAILRGSAYKIGCILRDAKVQPMIERMLYVAGSVQLSRFVMEFHEDDAPPMLQRLLTSQGVQITSKSLNRWSLDFAGCEKLIRDMIDAQPGGAIAREAEENFTQLAKVPRTDSQ